MVSEGHVLGSHVTLPSPIVDDSRILEYIVIHVSQTTGKEMLAAENKETDGGILTSKT